MVSIFLGKEVGEGGGGGVQRVLPYSSRST